MDGDYGKYPDGFWDEPEPEIETAQAISELEPFDLPF